MAITLRGRVVTPADSSNLYDSVERSIDPRGIGGSANDLVRMLCHRRGTSAINMNKLGGQSWTPQSLRQTGSTSARIFWSVFNGTWDAANLPSISSDLASNECIQIYLEMWAPTSGTNTWVLDQAEQYHGFNAPVGPGFNAATTGTHTSVGASCVATADFLSPASNTYAIQTAGWSNPGGNAQYRCTDPNTFRPISFSANSRIITSAGFDMGNPVTVQGGTATAGMWIYNVFREQGSGVTLSSINTGAALIENGQTGIVLTGTKSGASWSSVQICAINAFGDASAVNWPISSQTATTLTMAAIPLSSFNYYPSSLFVFAVDASSNHNSSGFVIQRGSSYSIVLTLQDKNAVALASQTFSYNVWATSINGTELDSGNVTSDGSGVIAIPKKSITPGSPVTPADDLYFEVFRDPSTAASSKSGSARLTTSTGLSYT